MSLASIVGLVFQSDSQVGTKDLVFLWNPRSSPLLYLHDLKHKKIKTFNLFVLSSASVPFKLCLHWGYPCGVKEKAGIPAVVLREGGGGVGIYYRLSKSLLQGYTHFVVFSVP